MKKRPKSTTSIPTPAWPDGPTSAYSGSRTGGKGDRTDCGGKKTRHRMRTGRVVSDAGDEVTALAEMLSILSAVPDREGTIRKASPLDPARRSQRRDQPFQQISQHSGSRIFHRFQYRFSRDGRLEAAIFRRRTKDHKPQHRRC